MISSGTMKAANGGLVSYLNFGAKITGFFQQLYCGLIDENVDV